MARVCQALFRRERRQGTDPDRAHGLGCGVG